MRTPKKQMLWELLRQAQKMIVCATTPIENWKYRMGVHLGSGQDACQEDWQEKHLGDSWTGGYDDSVWFQTTFSVPREMAGDGVFLNVDFGGELVLRLGGKLVGSFSSAMNDGWVHRDLFPMEHLEEGQRLEVELYGGINTAGFCDHYMAGERKITYTMAVARLIRQDKPTHRLCTLAETALRTMELTSDTTIAQRLYAAVDEALHLLDFDFESTTFYASVPTALEKLESEIAAIPWMPQGQVLMVGHSHIDVAWLWTVKEVERKVERTFSNTLMLMDYAPDYRFTQSQALLYEMIRANNPELFERMREKIRTGQWEVVGNAWVEADTNIASGESLIRQMLYGRAFFRREFGVESDIYWLPDCFGFSWALPQIIARSGMKYFVTAKLSGNDTNPFPHTLFRWRGASGHEVLAYALDVSYQGNYNPEYVEKTWERNHQRSVTGLSMGMYGYGDGGSGGTTTMLETGVAVRQMPGLPASQMSRAEAFFAGVEGTREQLPIYEDELYYENHRGTYTSQAFVKKCNRRGEFLLRNVELTRLLAGVQYDAPAVERLWKLLLVNQFHDIMPGTSIPQVYENCRREYDCLFREGEQLLVQAVEEMNHRIGLKKDSYVVWNFDTFAHSGMTEAGFYAKDVPALGYRVFEQDALPETEPVRVGQYWMENENLRVELDQNGEISRIYDRKNRREVLADVGNRLTVYQDKAIHETAWNLEADYVKKSWPLTQITQIRIVPDPYRGVIEVVRRFHLSLITQRIVLEPEADWIDFQTEVDWQETLKMLKVEFPVTIQAREATYEIAHGSITRPTHANTAYDAAKFEVCGHKFADLSEGLYGVSLINDCKYGYDIHGNRMRLTLLRSPTCPDQTADKGQHSFVYRLYPHVGCWQESRVLEHAFGLNNPLRTFELPANGRPAETMRQFIRISRRGVILDAYKRAEDGNGVILRIYEALSSRGEVEIELPCAIQTVTECNLMEENERELVHEKHRFRFDIRPNEVRSFRIQFHTFMEGSA